MEQGDICLSPDFWRGKELKAKKIMNFTKYKKQKLTVFKNIL
jgi:hypothetical protein